MGKADEALRLRSVARLRGVKALASFKRKRAKRLEVTLKDFILLLDIYFVSSSEEQPTKPRFKMDQKTATRWDKKLFRRSTPREM